MAAQVDLTYAQPAPVYSELGGRTIGVPYLSFTLPNERTPKDFKGARKVPNYTPDLEPGDEAIEALKKKLAEPPVLAAPTDKEPMLLYIAANSKAVSVAVVVERKEEDKECSVQ
ncbi:hypothetical protein ZWY2020_020412 [Hordeum vulgare]|nr:hypothetical protein ZWY2020_020412 [Hordeum vulgare]